MTSASAGALEGRHTLDWLSMPTHAKQLRALETGIPPTAIARKNIHRKQPRLWRLMRTIGLCAACSAQHAAQRSSLVSWSEERLRRRARAAAIDASDRSSEGTIDCAPSMHTHERASSPDGSVVYYTVGDDHNTQQVWVGPGWVGPGCDVTGCELALLEQMYTTAHSVAQFTDEK